MDAQITNTKTQRNLKVLLILAVVGLLTACGNSKSNSTPTNSGSNAFNINSQKPLANCNKSADANFSINTSIVADQNGQPSGEWIKLKFNFINSTITQSGNVIKFFKWRVANGQAVLSETPLQVSSYDFATGQTVAGPFASLPAEQVTGSHGFYVQLADPNGLFQVIKVVAYDKDGKVIGNLNSLIPEFYANPADYQFNSDGTTRSETLRNMHALNSATTTGWTAEQFQQEFSKFCF